MARYDYNYDEYDVLEDEMTEGEAFTFFIIIATIMALMFHYPIALVLRVVGFKTPLNPIKVVPVYAGSVAAGLGIWLVWDTATNP